MSEQKRIVSRAQRRRIGQTVRIMVDGPSQDHELVWQGRLPGQAPDIDPVVYLSETPVDGLRPGHVLEAEIVGSRGYDLVARVPQGSL
jgi:ribosomal protein S12 methylthiotransferase